MTGMLFAAFLMGVSPVVASVDGSATGRISAIDATDGGNFAFRVELEGRPKMCGTDADWAYLEPGRTNYQAMVSLLLSAYHSGQPVMISSYRDSTGYCTIGYIRMAR